MADEPNTEADPFAAIRAGTNAHRARHRCHAYPFYDGSVLGVIAAAADARRIVELGTALGYTALWLAYGAPRAQVDTIERDAEHVRIARENFAAAGLGARITAHEGDFQSVLPTLAPPYDLGFFDGLAPAPEHLAELRRLLRPRGVLVSSNLDFASAAPYRTELTNPARWLTSFAAEGGRTAISIRL